MRYEDRIVDEVQAASDIVDIIGQYIPLKRSGKNLKACCPFHQEKTPSFMVQPEKQIFHCFGCGAGGNVFSFLMRYENSSFPEVLRQLAERAHIRLPEPSAKQNEQASDNDRLYEIYRLAAEYYHAQFLDPVKGKTARDYFKKRGYDEAASAEFNIGWAPAVWRGLFEFLSKKGFPEPLLFKSGLIHRSPKGHSYDVFRGRLLFPIRNLQGKVVAFGGRLIGNEEGPKYLNSPENPIFHKRRELFGLDMAKKHIANDRPQLFVVEGYFDFLRLYQSGFKTTVATLGTSLTDDHVQVLKRFAEEAIVVYDGDKAGEAASLRGLEVFLEGGMNVKLARLPVGFDPDDFLEKKGAAAFQKILDDARDFFDYKLEVLLGRFNRWDSLGLMQITNEFLETFVKVQNPVLLDRYLKRLAGSLGVEENSLRSELSKLKKKLSAPQLQAAKRESFRSSDMRKTGKTDSTEEILLLSLIIEDRAMREKALEELSENDFLESDLRQIFSMLLGMMQEQQKIGWPQVLNRLDDEDLKKRLVTMSSLESDSDGKSKAFSDCLEKIKKKRLEKKLVELRLNIAKAEREGDHAQVGNFVKEYQTLLKQYR